VILQRHRDGGNEPLTIDHQRKERLSTSSALLSCILAKEPDHPPQEC
jgi:hypothetical protein